MVVSQTFAGTPLTPLYRVVSSALGTPVSTDTQFLDIFMREYTIWFSTAAGFIFDGPNSNREGIETHFFAEGVPTIATKLNLVASAIANVGNLGATNWLPAVQVEFELLPITSTIRDYLSKRIQIQQ